MDVDTSDILGQQTYPKVKEDLAVGSGLTFTKGAFALAAFLVLYVLAMRTWERVLVWRERSYKLSMRRRYGIPDNDHRPFNVAYADVVQARRNNEAGKKPQPASAVPTDRVAAPLERTIRQRPSSTPYVPGAYSSFAASGVSGEHNYLRFSTNGQASTDRYSLRTSAALNTPSTFESSPKKSGPARRSSRKNLDVDGDNDVRKRAFDEEEEFEEDEHDAKKTKVNGDEFIDGDEDIEWEDENDYVPVRGSKRGLGEDDEVGQSEQIRDKRARKVSLEKTPHTFVFDNEDMDVDLEEAGDEVPELLASSNRGKKRDRAEAGSTFGGDDEESSPEHDEDDARSRRRRRKRRTVSKRKSDAASSTRGKKRDRDIEDSGSDMENDDEVVTRSSRKKRGKRGSLAASRLDDDDNESLASSKSRRRRIGDEWESNGIKWKIGPNGQRLRQALVKKARQKFVMPKDSQHPDREANLEVFVETWLTEEEYQDAKSRHLLAWQDSPKPSAEPESLSVNTQLPRTPTAPSGKNLLWSSTNTPNGSPIGLSSAQTGTIGIPTGRQLAARDLYRSSVASPLRVNPFENPQKVAFKRIANAPGTPRGSLNDSTNGSPRVYKTYSKWEKQELEASAMNKIREAERQKQEKIKEQLEKEKAERERLEREKAEKEKAATAAAAAAAAKPPVVTITPADDKPPAATEPAKPSLFSFGKPASSETPKVPAATDASKFSLFNAPPLGSTSFTTPANSADKAPEKPATPFAMPSSTTSTPNAAPASSVPNFFSKPAQPAALPSASSPFGQPSATPASDAKKAEPAKSQFSFGAPAAPATPAAPTATPASTSSATTKNVFSFGQPAEKKDAAPTFAPSSGPSPFARLGAPNPPTTSTEQAKLSASPFSFGGPAAAKTASSFGAPSASTPTPVAVATSTAPTSAPKFDFGVTTSKPTGTTAGTSSLNGALGEGTTATSGSATATTTASPFSFKPTSSSATEVKGTTSSTPVPSTHSFSAPAVSESKEAPKPAASSTPTLFSFGASASRSMFGSKPAAPIAPESKEALKSTLPFAPTSSTTAPSTTASAAGGSSAFSSSPFGGTSNAFGSSAFGGASAGKPADKPAAPLTFSFGAPPVTSATPVATSEAPKNGLVFGSTSSTTPSATPAAPSSGGLSFNFNGSKLAGSTTPFSALTTAPAFGGSSAGPSAFGFGKPNATTTSTFGAGASGAGGEQQQQK